MSNEYQLVDGSPRYGTPQQTGPAQGVRAGEAAAAAAGLGLDHLAAPRRRCQASGSAKEILWLRLGLMLALIVLPAYVVASSGDDLLKLVLVGAACVAASFIGGHFLAVRARVPVMPDLRAAWLAELRDDVTNAALVANLQN